MQHIDSLVVFLLDTSSPTLGLPSFFSIRGIAGANFLSSSRFIVEALEGRCEIVRVPVEIVFEILVRAHGKLSYETIDA